MRHLSAFLTVALVLVQPAPAGEFAARVPADTLLYIESRDVPENYERYMASPLGESLQAFDWKNAVVFFSQLAEGEEEEDTELSSEEQIEMLESFESRLSTLLSFLSGDHVVTVGQFTDVVDVFSANQELRKEGMMEEMDQEEADPEELERLEREKELDATEIASLFGTISMLADVRDDKDLEAELASLMTDLQPLLHPLPGQIRSTTKTREDITFYSLKISLTENAPVFGLFTFVHEGVWALAFTEQQIHTLADHMRTAPGSPLASSPAFQQAVRSSEGADAFSYLDFSKLDRLFRHALKTQENLPSSGNMSPEGFLDWMDFGALLPITQSTRLVDNGVRTNGQFGFKRETALSRILFSEDTSPAPTPPFLHRDISQFTVMNWHLGDFWTRLETELMKMAPEAAAGLGMVRMLATGQLGFDIKLQFLDHLDSGLVFIQTIDPEVMAEMQTALQSEDPAKLLEVSAEHPTGGQNYLIGLELKNEAPVREAIDRLVRRFNPQGAPEPQMLAGIEILNPIPQGAAGGLLDDFLNIAFMDGWLLVSIGTTRLLEQAVQASGQEDLRIWQDAGFQSLRAALSEKPDSMQYSSGAQQMDALNMMQSSLRFLAEPSSAEVPDFSSLGTFMKAMLQTSTRQGLKITTDSFLEFQD